MIVHLFPQEKFTVPFIKLINSTFNINEHLFIVHGRNVNYRKHEVEQYNNIIYVNRDNKNNLIESIRYINKADKIILHSLFIPNCLKYYLFINKSIIKKSNWVLWGGDLYLYKIRSKNFKSDLNELIRKRIITNLGGVITHIKGDYELAKEWYGAKGKYMYSFMYPSNLYKYYDLPKSNINNNGIIYVQVGNSADPTNNHFDIFNKLEKYSDKNIKVICPLSYGNEEYRNRVIDEGNRIFGNKFSPLLDFMDLQQYLGVLSKIDVAIFNHKRQQAVGNITSLLGFGKKVYIRSDITTWEFCKAHDLKVFDATENFIDLLTPLGSNDSAKNIENVKKYFSEEKLVSDWQKIFRN